MVCVLHGKGGGFCVFIILYPGGLGRRYPDLWGGERVGVRQWGLGLDLGVRNIGTVRGGEGGRMKDGSNPGCGRRKLRENQGDEEEVE